MVFKRYENPRIRMVKVRNFQEHFSDYLLSVGIYNDVVMMERKGDVKGIILQPNEMCYEIIKSNIHGAIINEQYMEEIFRSLNLNTISSSAFKVKMGPFIDDISTNDPSSLEAYLGLTHHKKLTAVLMSPYALPNMFLDYLSRAVFGVR